MENLTLNNIFGMIVISAILIFSFLFYTPTKQKIWIKNISDSTLYITSDTIIADKSVWYYEPDSSYNKTIRLTIYRDKEGKPYENIDLVPNDFIYLKLKSGVNWVHLNSIGTHPFITKKIKIIKIKEKK